MNSIKILSLLALSNHAISNHSGCDSTAQQCSLDAIGFLQSKLWHQPASKGVSASAHLSHQSMDKCPPSLPTKCPEGICLESGRECAAKWYQELRTNRSKLRASTKNVVAITYCDVGFAQIWPTFIDCYKQALGCTVGIDPEACGASKPKLIDLGLSHKPGQTGNHCSHTGMPSWTKDKLPSPSHLELTPTGVPTLILENMLEQLSLGQDVLRLDADAFLLDDPMHIFEQFPDADIISSPDFVQPHTSGSSQVCDSWYCDEAYKTRHPSDDPFGRWGFMMNTGLTYIRSNDKTTHLVRSATNALISGRTTFEQIALNEELADLRCNWSEPEKLPSGGNASQNWHILVTTPLLGNCANGMKVVVLPYYDMTRTMEQAPRAISVHVAGDKVLQARMAAAICNGRTNQSQTPNTNFSAFDEIIAKLSSSQ